MTENNTEQNDMLNNPLHGLKLEKLLAEYTRIKCFEKNPSIAASLKFLRKTEWAREKMERFYLYNFKNLPKADDVNFELPPRKRIIPAHQKPREPAVLILGEAPEPKVRAARTNNSNSTRPFRESNRSSRNEKPRTSSREKTTSNSSNKIIDPWAESPK